MMKDSENYFFEVLTKAEDETIMRFLNKIELLPLINSNGDRINTHFILFKKSINLVMMMRLRTKMIAEFYRAYDQEDEDYMDSDWGCDFTKEIESEFIKVNNKIDNDYVNELMEKMDENDEDSTDDDKSEYSMEYSTIEYVTID